MDKEQNPFSSVFIRGENNYPKLFATMRRNSLSCSYRPPCLLDARLICGVEEVALPVVVVAVCVVVYQINGVALGRIASDGIPEGAACDANPNPISVGRIGFELIPGTVEDKDSLYPIVAGHVVQEIVVVGAIQRKPVLVISRRRVSS